MTRLRDKYREELVPRLMEELGCDNRLAAPRLVKICLNMGVGGAREEEEGAFLFHPESGELSCLNPVGIRVWKQVTGDTPLRAIVDAIVSEYPEEDREAILGDVRLFLADLKAFGYVAWDET